MAGSWKKKIERAAARLASATAQVKRVQSELADTTTMLNRLTEAQSIIQNVAQAVQQQAHEQIAGVVSRCLEAVFDEPYKFQIKFERKRGRTEARLVFLRKGFHEIDPLTAAGGGVVDVAAFALRLACLTLARPRVRRLIVLDEPFKFVSAAYRPRIKAMLETLADEMSIQFIMVTHIPELQTGTVIELE